MPLAASAVMLLAVCLGQLLEPYTQRDAAVLTQLWQRMPWRQQQVASEADKAEETEESGLQEEEEEEEEEHTVLPLSTKAVLVLITGTFVFCECLQVQPHAPDDRPQCQVRSY